MLGDMTPFRLAGNIYFVGTHAASCHMIDTGDGLILIDVGYESSADVVTESLEILGFDVKDVKYILLSHGHGDHSDGVPQIVARSGAKVFLFREDARYLKGFEPDVYFIDGDVIRLGNTEIRVLHTPGHTEGTASFFLDIEENGRKLRAGMFGGAGTNQLRKPFLDTYSLKYAQRGQYFRSLERLRGEHVDVFLGNHTWNNDTRGNYEKSLVQQENPFVDASRWGEFLNKCERDLENVINEEIGSMFVNYAHRGASEYLPENTFMAFYTGLYMGANGIETDVRRTKDGELVLFHDDTLERVTGEPGSIADHTYAQLQEFFVRKNGYKDKIVRFEDFLARFCYQDITFAIELKDAGIGADVAALLRKYDMSKKTVVTSFSFDYIAELKACAPEFRVGLLVKPGRADDETVAMLKSIGADEICPYSHDVNAENVRKWHREGFRVRAWGLDREYMKRVYDAGADGMTVNFPDLLTAYIAEKNDK